MIALLATAFATSTVYGAVVAYRWLVNAGEDQTVPPDPGATPIAPEPSASSEGTWAVPKSLSTTYSAAGLPVLRVECYQLNKAWPKAFTGFRAWVQDVLDAEGNTDPNAWIPVVNAFYGAGFFNGYAPDYDSADAFDPNGSKQESIHVEFLAFARYPDKVAMGKWLYADPPPQNRVKGEPKTRGDAGFTTTPYNVDRVRQAWRALVTAKMPKKVNNLCSVHPSAMCAGRDWASWDIFGSALQHDLFYAVPFPSTRAKV
jgi:hypothetical protein